MKQTLFSLLMVTAFLLSMPVSAQDRKKNNSGTKKESYEVKGTENSDTEKGTEGKDKKEAKNSTAPKEAKEKSTVTCATTKKLIVENKSCGKK